MLVLRLQRIGKRKKPSYRLIVSEKTKDTQAGSLEILGHYTPVQKEKRLVLEKDRIAHYLSVGAVPSETVRNLLIHEGILSGSKAKSVKISQKRQKKLDDVKATRAAEQAAKAAKAAEATAPAPEPEAPAV